MSEKSINRIEILRKYIDEVLLNMTDVVERRCAYVHLYGVAQSCTLIALKRGENVELAVMAGMLHDIYSYAKMDTVDHARNSTTLAREILAGLNQRERNELIGRIRKVHASGKATMLIGLMEKYNYGDSLRVLDLAERLATLFCFNCC